MNKGSIINLFHFGMEKAYLAKNWKIHHRYVSVTYSMALSHRMKIVVILGAKQQTIVFIDKVCGV
jgi:hypothetical protein